MTEPPTSLNGSPCNIHRCRSTSTPQGTAHLANKGAISAKTHLSSVRLLRAVWPTNSWTEIQAFHNSTTTLSTWHLLTKDQIAMDECSIFTLWDITPPFASLSSLRISYLPSLLLPSLQSNSGGDHNYLFGGRHFNQCHLEAIISDKSG